MSPRLLLTKSCQTLHEIDKDTHSTRFQILRYCREFRH